MYVIYYVLQVAYFFLRRIHYTVQDGSNLLSLWIESFMTNQVTAIAKYCPVVLSVMLNSHLQWNLY